MNFKGVIFDLDGTLADTGADLADAINLMLQSFGFEAKSQSDILKHINFGARAFVGGCLPEDAKDISDEAFTRYIGFYRERCLDKTYIYGGVPELIKTLVEYDIKLCVLSNKPDDTTKKIVSGLLDAGDFTEIIGGSDKFPHKPSPESSLYLANEMRARPDEIVFIGDSDVDMKTAVNASMFPLGVSWGYRTENVILGAGAKKIAHNPGEILEFILK